MNNEYNQILLQDLKNWFRGRKKTFYKSLFMKVRKGSTPHKKTHYEYITEEIFSVFHNELVNAILTNTNGGPQYLRTHIDGRYFNHGYRFEDFLTYLLSKKGMKLKLDKMDVSYKSFLNVRSIYRLSGHDKFEVEVPPRYGRTMRLTFTRFKANPKCVVTNEDCKEIMITLE